MPRQTPRPRPPRACSRCAARKVSCDKKRPQCSRCARVNLECHYASPGHSTAGTVTIIDETPSVVSLQTRLTRLSQMMANGAAEDDKMEESDTNTQDKTLDPGYLLRDKSTKSKYLSPTFFAAISQEISELEDLARKQEKEQDAMSNNSSRSSVYGDLFPSVPLWATLDDNTASSPDTSTDDIVELLPSTKQCEVLLWAYMAGYHTMKPIFHASTFLRQAQEFERWRKGKSPDFELCAHWLALFIAVIFAGAVVCPRARLRQIFESHTSRETLSAQLYDLAIKAVRLTNFPQSPSLSSLSAFIIIDSTWLREEQPLTCCSFIGVAFRVAQMLGLHREPSKFPDIDQIEIETRRRLWWTVVSLDAQVAFAASLPPLIEPKLYTVEQISESGELQARPTAETAEQANKSILGLFSRAKFMFYGEASTFLHTLNNYRLEKSHVDSVLSMIGQIRLKIEAAKAEINAIEQRVAVGPDVIEQDQIHRIESNKALARFTWTVLSMLADKPYAILYGPLRKHCLLDYLREKEPDAISSHCRDYLHRFLILTQSHDFQPWHWCWPGQHQPLHSMMALITELDDFPNAPLANETRKLVDLALHMCGTSENGGIQSKEDGQPDPRHLGGGGEAWRIIRRARDRVWKKAGLDPDVLVCPESAEDIDFENPSEAGERMDLSRGMYDTDWMPQSVEDWAFLEDATGPLWDLDDAGNAGMDFGDL